LVGVEGVVEVLAGVEGVVVDVLVAAGVGDAAGAGVAVVVPAGVAAGSFFSSVPGWLLSPPAGGFILSE
jgi:hypothetical protein